MVINEPAPRSPRRKAPTIKDIAVAAGVSKSAVSRALLGQGEVSTETRERVEKAATELGYVANAMAAGLRARTRTIGAVLRDIRRPYYSHLFTAMHEQAEAHGYRLVTMTSAEELDVDSAIGAVKSLVSLQVDGLVLASAQLDSELIAPFVDRVPMVVAGRMEVGSAIPGVYGDEHDAGVQLARLVVAAGHRRVGVALVAREYSLSQHLRGVAMLEALTAAGVHPVTFDVASDREMGPAIDATLSAQGVSALMCPTDDAAVDVLDVLRVRGLRCPDDLSVTAYGGVGPLASPLLGLTTFRQPVERIGQEAVDLLVRIIEEPDTQSPSSHLAIRGDVIAGRTLASRFA